MTVTIKAAQALAADYQLDNVDRDVLLSHILGKDRSYLLAFSEVALTETQLRQLLNCYDRRQKGEPVAYITGSREFWSLSLQTSPDTLIPRPDTEVLVETVLARFDGKPKTVVDLGTGTGAIALAVKSERPGWNVTGIDRVAAAVQLAELNAQRLNLAVTFQLGSWCDSIADNSLDILLSNPPYIDAEDEHLSQGDVRFEPRSALVADDSGLADIEQIARQGHRVLVAGGGLMLEHGWQQAAAVQAILMKNAYQRIETVQDYGGNDRVTIGYRPKS